jgi:hypothetical protein
MNTNFMLKLSLLLTLIIYITTVTAQDSVKKATVKKTIVAKPVITAAQPGGIPINPKTGRPYSKYGYGPYAKTFRAKQKADSLKKTTAASQPVHVSPTPVTATPPAVKPDSTAAAPPRVDKSLNGQYQYLLTKVYAYQRPFVEAIWKNFTDTLKNTRGQLKAANDKVAEQNKTITGLQADVAAKEQTITQTDTISLLGIALAKSTYNIIMWGLVIAFGIIAGVVIARSGGAQKEATYRTTLYNELEEEFKTFKAKANEKEKKLARELQTERNRVDELTGRG